MWIYIGIRFTVDRISMHVYVSARNTIADDRKWPLKSVTYQKIVGLL